MFLTRVTYLLFTSLMAPLKSLLYFLYDLDAVVAVLQTVSTATSPAEKALAPTRCFSLYIDDHIVCGISFKSADCVLGGGRAHQAPTCLFGWDIAHGVAFTILTLKIIDLVANRAIRMHSQAYFFIALRVCNVITFRHEVHWVAEALAQFLCTFGFADASLTDSLRTLWLVILSILSYYVRSL